MAVDPKDGADSGRKPGVFASTHWSVVQAAGRLDTPEAAGALEILCRTYWYPLYAFIRRSGYGADDARDLAQGFFCQLLQKNYVGKADPERGRFRSFLLITLKRFLRDEVAKASARKRGGGIPPISLDAAAGESRYQLEPVEELTPEMLFERRWAEAVIEQAVHQIEQECQAKGQAREFAELRAALPGERGEASCAVMAQRLGWTESAVKGAVYRLRLRHRELVRATIAHAVGNPDEVDDELRHLIQVLGA